MSAFHGLFAEGSLIAPILLRTTLAMVVAFVGGILGVCLGPRIAAKQLNELVFAAMGALVAVTLFDVLPEAKAVLSWPVFVVATISGYALFWAISRYLYHICPACAFATLDERTSSQLQSSAGLLMTALAIHSTVDGLAVSVGDEMAGHANLAVLLGVSFHKLPEGLALAVILLGAGYSQRAALLWTLLVESSTELGGVLGSLSMMRSSMPALGALFAHVGGGFLYLAVSSAGNLFPGQGKTEWKWRAKPIAISGVVTFVVIACLLSVIRRYAP